jgi:hypothetical protein
MLVLNARRLATPHSSAFFPIRSHCLSSGSLTRASASVVGFDRVAGSGSCSRSLDNRGIESTNSAWVIAFNKAAPHFQFVSPWGTIDEVFGAFINCCKAFTRPWLSCRVIAVARSLPSLHRDSISLLEPPLAIGHRHLFESEASPMASLNKLDFRTDCWQASPRSLEG